MLGKTCGQAVEKKSSFHMGKVKAEVVQRGKKRKKRKVFHKIIHTVEKKRNGFQQSVEKRKNI